MSDRWDFYFHQVGQNTASSFVDLDIQKEAPDRKKPELARVRLQMLLPREDGLSSADEYEILREVEDQLTNNLKKSAAARYVGRTTAGGTREFCFYAPKAIQQGSVSEALRSFPEYKFEVSCVPDPDWRHYLDVLYPSDEEFETIKNAHVLDALEKHGDDLSQKRPVTHWSFFKTNLDRQAFLSEALEMGYSIHDLHEDGPDETPFVACLERDDHVDYGSINDVVVELFQITQNHYGFYDGWETQVMEGLDQAEESD